MLVCPYCQAQNADTAIYCVRCGQTVGQPAPGAAPGVLPTGGQKTGLAMTSLIIGILSLPTAGCLGVGALAAIICGIVALNRAKKDPAVYGGSGLAIGGIVTGGVSIVLVPVVIGIVAAIAIPSLLRARVSANESATIGDTRTVIAAQTAYAAANGGYYDTLECLGVPASCIPSYPHGTQALLDPLLISGQPKSGYRRTFHAGPAVDTSQVSQPVSPSSITAYAYVAVPMNQGQTGVRAFCGDARGVVCYTADGSEPEVVEGECSIGGTCVAMR